MNTFLTTDAETGVDKRLSNLPKVMQLASVGTRAQTQAV